MVSEARESRKIITRHVVGQIVYKGKERPVFIDHTTTSLYESWEFFIDERNIPVSVDGEDWTRTEDYHAKCDVTYPKGQQFWCTNCNKYI